MRERDRERKGVRERALKERKTGTLEQLVLKQESYLKRLSLAVAYVCLL